MQSLPGAIAAGLGATVTASTNAEGSGYGVELGACPVHQGLRGLHRLLGILRAEHIHRCCITESIRVAGGRVKLVERSCLGSPLGRRFAAQFTQKCVERMISISQQCLQGLFRCLLRLKTAVTPLTCIGQNCR